MTTSGTCPIVGLVGGVGSGKSSLAQSLAKRFGAVIVDGDAAGHRALARTDVKDRLRARFGMEIFNASGAVDRAALARIVFGPADHQRTARCELENITHPFIREDIQTRIEAGRESGATAIILDAAILLETGWRQLCETIVFIDASEDHRRSRAANRGWTHRQWRDREAAQLDIREKRNQADVVIDNNGSLSEAADQMAHYLRSLGVVLTEESLTPSP